jgi:predicted kinase
MKVLVLRGPSGTGKSTWAKEKKKRRSSRRIAICSADNYFIDDEGNYNFDPCQLPIAHQTCMEQFILCLYGGEVDTIMVDNTNIHTWEYSSYMTLAKLHPAVDIIQVHEWFPEDREQLMMCINRNAHGVPAEVVVKMWLEYEFDMEGVIRHPIQA